MHELALSQGRCKAGSDRPRRRTVSQGFWAKENFGRPASLEFLKLTPLFADALASRGAVWMRKKDYARAQADLDQSLSLRQSVLTYFARGQLFEAQGKLDQAIADFRKAIELKPGNIFDATAQTVAKSRLEALARNNSCGKNDQRCL